MATLRHSLSKARSKKGSSLLTAGLTVGAALAITALLVRRAARKTEQRHPPTGRFVEVSGVRLHYLEIGTGDPVVLLHGNGLHARDFVGSGLANALARHYRVIAFDRPGFGYSQRPRSHIWSPQAQATLLRAAFAQLGIEQPVVIGHSWGTMVALALALQHPNALRGLLLLSGYYYPTMRWDSVLESPPAIPLLGDLMNYTVAPLLARLTTPSQVRQLFAPEPVPTAFHEAVPLEMMLRPWQLRAAAAEAALMMPAARSLAKRFSELHLPVTIVAGTGDRIVDHQAHAARLHRDLPQSRLLLIPERGHMLHYT